MDNNKPMFGGAVFCNSVSKGEQGKLDCHGVFTSFLAWAYPTVHRSWHAVFTIYNLPSGLLTVTISISSKNNNKLQLGKMKLEKTKDDIGIVLDALLLHQFDQEGFYDVHFESEDIPKSLIVPVRVVTKPWPKFTKKQLDFLRDNPTVPHSVRMNVLCAECSRPYIFEYSIFSDEKFADGVLPVPNSGEYECDSCGHLIMLKDLQGQVRDSIKKAVVNAMRKSR